MIVRLDHVAFTVDDLDRSLTFYDQHFGFKEYSRQTTTQNPKIKQIAYLRLGDSVIELVHIPGSRLGGGYHFCLQVEDFDAEVKRLVDAGVPVVTPPHPTLARTPAEQNWRRVVFGGPDGEQIELRGA